MMADEAELQAELHAMRQNGLADELAKAAKEADIPVAFFYAIASRETNCTNELGDEDDNGEYHGVGIVQIDIQHDIARQARDSGSWKTDPAPLIAFGANMLAEGIHAVQVHCPGYTEEQQLKVAASGYNDGIMTAIDDSQNRGDSDADTTGDDYGADVVARMHVFEQLLA